MLRTPSWRATTAEDEAAMRQGYEEYQKIEKEIEQLNAIKERMGTLTKGELNVIQGMSKEGYEVYRNLQSDLFSFMPGWAENKRPARPLTVRKTGQKHTVAWKKRTVH